MKKKAAVIGLGPMGMRQIEAIRTSEHLEIYAVVDLDKSILEKVRLKFSDRHIRTYTDYRLMLKESSPDLVVIATNGPSHEQIFMDIADCNIRYVLCEKPIATSIDGAARMIQRARDCNMKLLVNHARRWCDDYIALRQKLRDGIIGTAESVLFTMGGGQLGCNGSHMIDLIHFLLESNTTSVFGKLNDLGTPNPRGNQFHDPGAFFIGQLANNKRYFLEMPEDLGTPPFIIINGSYGRMVIEETKKRIVIERRRKQDWAMPHTRYGIPLVDTEEIEIKDLDIVNLTRKALDALVNDVVLADPQLAVNALEVIAAVHESDKLGVPVSIPLADKRIKAHNFSFT